MSLVYRSGTYRGKSSIAEQANPNILHTTFYPYASKSGNIYSHGVCRIVDARSPFGSFGPVIMYPSQASYKGPSRISSNATFPLFDGHTVMTLNINTSPYFIETTEEPLYKNSDKTRRYYTYNNNDATLDVKALILSDAEANKYLLNMIDTTFTTPSTGPLHFYGFFAMLNLLLKYKERALNYIDTENISRTLLTDYELEKPLFYNRGMYGYPTGDCSIWRALPDNNLITTLLPEREIADIADIKSEIVEFVVKNIYSIYVELWDARNNSVRGYVV